MFRLNWIFFFLNNIEYNRLLSDIYINQLLISFLFFFEIVCTLSVFSLIPGTERYFRTYKSHPYEMESLTERVYCLLRDSIFDKKGRGRPKKSYLDILCKSISTVKSVSSVTARIGIIDMALHYKTIYNILKLHNII